MLGIWFVARQNKTAKPKGNEIFSAGIAVKALLLKKMKIFGYSSGGAVLRDA